MRVAVVDPGEAAHVDDSVRLADGDGHVTAGRLVVDVAVERPVRRATGNVSEAGAQVQQAAQVFKLHALGRTRGSMRVAVIDPGEAAHVDDSVRLADGDGHITAGRLVVDVAVERPVGRATGDVSEAGAQVQQAAQVFKLHALGRTRGPVCVAVIDPGEAAHVDDSVRLADGDGHITAGRLVVDVAVERPVGRAAGDVSEAGAQVQQAAQVFKLHALGRTRGPVCVAVIDPGEAAHVYDSVRLADGDGHITAGRLVVDVAVERPVGRATGDVSEAGAQVQQAAQVFKLHALGRTRGSMRVAVIDPGEAAHVDDSVRLADGDGHITAGRLVGDVAVERPVGRATGDVSEAGAQVQQAAQVFKLHALGRTRGSMRVAVIDPGEAAHVDDSVRLADGDGHITAGRLVVDVAVERPV